MDTGDKLAAASGVIAASVFWLVVIAFRTNGFDVNAYRQGYAEGKAGLPQRWERAMGGREIK